MGSETGSLPGKPVDLAGLCCINESNKIISNSVVWFGRPRSLDALDLGPVF